MGEALAGLLRQIAQLVHPGTQLHSQLLDELA
jgi:hypothetical protein